MRIENKTWDILDFKSERIYEMEFVRVIVLLMMLCTSVDGHARFIEPPSRSSMWRYGFDTPHNTNDQGLNCGGLSVQWDKHNGKCGICGDNLDDDPPRANEYGGKYGKGIIVRTYQEGQTIEAKSTVTANHLGKMEYRLCEKTDVTATITQDCFDAHLLVGEDGVTTSFPITKQMKDVTHRVTLPTGLTCDACMLQWTYTAGNNWGIDEETGKGCRGCGKKQETFQTCSDIAIEERATDTKVTVHTNNTTPTTFPEVDEEVPDSNKNCNCLDAATSAVCHFLPTRPWSNRH